MKLFAILTAGLMAAGGGAYFYSNSTCSTSACSLRGAPVAQAGGCCQTAEASTCDATKEECSAALSVSTSAKPSCCAANEECCLILAACCTAEKVSAASKPLEITGCCESCTGPARTLTAAAKSIASPK